MNRNNNATCLRFLFVEITQLKLINKHNGNGNNVSIVCLNNQNKWVSKIQLLAVAVAFVTGSKCAHSEKEIYCNTFGEAFQKASTFLTSPLQNFAPMTGHQGYHDGKNCGITMDPKNQKAQQLRIDFKPDEDEHGNIIPNAGIVHFNVHDENGESYAFIVKKAMEQQYRCLINKLNQHKNNTAEEIYSTMKEFSVRNPHNAQRRHVNVFRNARPSSYRSQ